MQACWRAITAKLFCSVITFKATAKGPGKLENSAFRDLWLPGLSFVVLMISVVSCSSMNTHDDTLLHSIVLQKCEMIMMGGIQIEEAAASFLQWMALQLQACFSL